MKPDGLNRNTKGFKAAVRVRILHSIIRKKVSENKDWRLDEWGLPVNQADLISTNLAFSIVYLTGLWSLGYKFTEKEKKAYLHFWKYVGYVSGHDISWLPETEQEALRLIYIVAKTQPNPDEDSLHLAQALYNQPLESAKTLFEKIQGWLEKEVHTGYSQFFLGKSICDELGLHDTPFKFLPALIAPGLWTVETLRQIIPFGTDLAVAVGSKILDFRMSQALADIEAEFKPYEKVTA